MMLSLISLLAGAVLGQRYKVLVLVPATILTLIFAVGFAITETPTQMLGAAIAAAISVQIGYIAGVFIRAFTAASRAGATGAKFIAAPSLPRRVANQDL